MESNSDTGCLVALLKTAALVSVLLILIVGFLMGIVVMTAASLLT